MKIILFIHFNLVKENEHFYFIVEIKISHIPTRKLRLLLLFTISFSGRFFAIPCLICTKLITLLRCCPFLITTHIQDLSDRSLRTRNLLRFLQLANRYGFSPRLTFKSNIFYYNCATFDVVFDEFTIQ